MEALERARNDPNERARQRLSQIVNDAVHDPVLKAQPGKELIRTLCTLREAVADLPAASTTEQVAEWFARWAGHLAGKKGGRPTKDQHWAQWEARYLGLKRTRPTLTAEERYEEVLAEWHAKGHSDPRRWQGIRDGISELKKRRKVKNIGV